LTASATPFHSVPNTAELPFMTARRFVHVTIRGRVQGVGFRAFIERQAQERGLDGWVRNREDGSVEAVFAGASAAVDAVLGACRQGPPGAAIEDIDVREEEAAGLIPSSRPAGFFVMPTV
jgi:acylphosphatase